MIYLENPKTVKQKQITDTEKGTRKTLILVEVDNGYIFIKRTEKLAEDGYVAEKNDMEENIFVYKENPMDDSDDIGSSLSEVVEKLK